MKTVKDIYAKHWIEYVNKCFKISKGCKPEDLDTAGGDYQYILEAMIEYAEQKVKERDKLWLDALKHINLDKDIEIPEITYE